MFFRRKEPQIRPPLKKASELINKSRTQKKYISLMLVPSDSTGKTRSLNIPRTVIYGAAACVAFLCMVIMGFYLRSVYHEREAVNLSTTLEEVQETFQTFQQEAEIMQSELIDATEQMSEQLNEEQTRAQQEISRQEREHQNALEDIWDLINGLENQIREFEEVQQEIVSGLSTRRIIPPIANILDEMEKTHDNLREALRYEAPPQGAPTVGLLSHAAPANSTTDELLFRLNFLQGELEIQRALLENIEQYKKRVEPYLLNYPTIWPVNGSISSGFGWRSNPFGRSGNEFHSGVDIPAKSGTAIRAAGGGTVIFQGWRNGYGNTVEIDHGDGIVTLYAHNTRNSVTQGQRVERGGVIAYAGSTGRSTGSHLHYEVQKNGTAVNPMSFLLE
ncbi:MAG: peptidoglycan DD-metalloendopeptidase family protein [Defluviitaleaceae bacterium]|nr:peptidoglycan DD-metalloendopeptidase family protein [Defluviitaleaceae bacterium]